MVLEESLLFLLNKNEKFTFIQTQILKIHLKLIIIEFDIS